MTASRLAAIAAGALAVAAACAWTLPRTPAIVITSIAVVVTIVSIGVSAARLRRFTGFDLDFLVGALWLPAMFGFMLPPLALILGAIRTLRPTIGGYSTIKDGGGGRHYPKISLPGGEAKPFGYTCLAIGALWPIAALGLIFAR